MPERRVLVTGGAGFIGSHLMERLLAEGSRVICFDNFDHYYDPEIKKRNIARCRAHPRFTLVRGDIRNPAGLRRAFAAKPGIVVHLAAMAGIRPSMDHPVLFEDVNVRGTMEVLRECVRRGVKKIVFASSSSVYGDTRRIPFRETDTDNYPISVYGSTKLHGELLCRIYHHHYGLNITALRFFTAYGPRQRPDMAIHKFAAAIARGAPVTLYGDGTSQRDYTYVDDIVDGIVRSMDRVKGFTIYNLGESQRTTLKALVSLLEKHMGKKARIRNLPYQEGDPFVTSADVSRARKDLGYRPTVSIDEGVRRFVEWFKDRY